MGKIEFSGRVALVTGAGNGLGRDYALQLAKCGASVVVNDFAGKPDGSGDGGAPADQVVNEIRTAGGIAVANHASVATRAGADSMVASAIEHFGRIDILINNAGNQRNKRFEDISDEDFGSVLDVHLNGAFYVSQTAYKTMMAQRYGRIIFTSSSSGVFGNYLRANYAAAKTGLIGLMHSIAIEGERYGITANAVLPFAASPRMGKAPQGALHPDWLDKMPEAIPGIEVLAGAMSAQYVTPLLLYLASERCTSTHAVWSALAGRYARSFIGMSKGWLAPAGGPPTPEEIESRLALIEDRAGHDVPMSVADELAPVVEALKRR
jgi:NAD(P)-dependent dehydrogenase (short-subunit alcohol dehydrogenase family)